ncbi:mitochondrial ribosomal protein L16 [Flagelloscypha sp. PMI_526]|nr:mitochondrial ribosomal protein L16 [Flagelloscypha sp. PMI_526]
MASLCQAFAGLRLTRSSLSTTPSNPLLSRLGGVRHRAQLAPVRIKYTRRHKGKVNVPIGGSVKGTTLCFGDWGLRVKGDGARISAKTLTSAREVLLRRLKVIKGTKVYLRTFPDLPVAVKGNETRMGKGKGTFEYWARRIPTGKVVFEIGGKPIREELARKIFREVESRFPTKMEFITRQTPARLGRLLLDPEELKSNDPAKLPNVPTQLEISSVGHAIQP